MVRCKPQWRPFTYLSTEQAGEDRFLFGEETRSAAVCDHCSWLVEVHTFGSSSFKLTQFLVRFAESCLLFGLFAGYPFFSIAFRWWDTLSK